MKKINETYFWKELGKYSLIERLKLIEKGQVEIEGFYKVKIIDRNYIDFSEINNPVMPVQDDIRNIVYLKEFVPKVEAA